MDNAVTNFIRSMPLVTRFLFVGCGLTTLLVNFGLIPFASIYFSPSLIFKSFEIWRLVTPFLFMGKLGLDFLFLLYFLYKYSTMLETGTFINRQADYFYLVLVNSILLLVFGLVIPSFIFMTKGLIMSIMYIWSRYYPEMDVTFFFGMKFKSIYLPWVFMGFNILMGGLPIMEFCGVICGHVYYYISEIYPEAYRKPNYLATPSFIKGLFNQPDQVVAAGGVRGGAQPPQRAQGHQWGGGNRLG
ncbi:derlin-1 [Tieghemostelium lacteum]|uniref:Derlin n=1 Tax=Tieghemostelium lacteum TaxID=361077 RepID=A0A152A1K1_TIELA|nr:derlin-1 [Tieghemostelium lacteum]|eukprot:KYQ99964.1 derlin-1 [Tieghemostelium lacteum]